MKRIIVIDTETTGPIPGSAELLQISIISGSGSVLFNHYIKPVTAKSWPGAQRINHISPEMVKHCRTVDHYIPKLQNIIDNADIIVGYNLKNFDIPVLENAGLHFGGEIVDVYLENMKDDTLSRHRLVDVAKKFGYTFTPHDSLEDCRATLHIYNKTHTSGKKKSGISKNKEIDNTAVSIASSTNHNLFGRTLELLRTIVVIAFGVFLINILYRCLQPYFKDDIRLYVSITVAGLYCYLTSGLTGPITAGLGYGISFWHSPWTKENTVACISLMISVMALRILFKYTKRYKWIIIRFIMCTLAIAAASFVFYFSSGYINGALSGIPFVMHRIDWRDPTSIVCLCLLATLPFDMLLSGILCM